MHRNAMRAASRALAPPMTVRYTPSAPEYDHTQDSRNYVFDEQKMLMANMYTGQENAAGERSQAVAAATAADDRVPTIAPQILARTISQGPVAEEYYFVFDTYNQGVDRLTPDSGITITFPFTAITGQPSLDDIAAMRIEPFYLPTLNSPDGSPQFFFDRRIMMYISSLQGSQYIYSADPINYQFVFDIDFTNAQTTHVTPLNPDFVFRQKPGLLTELTVRFFVGAPARPIRIPYDQVPVRIRNGSNPGEVYIVSDQSTDLIIGGLARLNSVSYPYLLPSKVAVVFTEFEDSAVIPDVTEKNKFLSPDGVFVTHIVSPDSIRLEGINFSSLSGDSTTYVFKMFIRKNRISFGMRFTSTKTGSNATLARNYL